MEADAGLEARVDLLLRECSTMTLATSGPEGLWAADVFFAPQSRPSLVFISSPTSRHALNAFDSPAVAATIHAETGSDWRTIRGLQMEGEVALVSDDEIGAAQEAYFVKFPFAAALLRPDSAVQNKTAGTRFFAFRVRRMYLVDNRLRFGVRLEVLLER